MERFNNPLDGENIVATLDVLGDLTEWLLQKIKDRLEKIMDFITDEDSMK